MSKAFPSGLAKIAGSNNSSAIAPQLKMTSISKPNCRVGTNVLSKNTESPSPLITAACNVGLQHPRNAASMATFRSEVLSWQCLYQCRKWIVSSTATPNAILAVIMQPMSTGIPSQPIDPNTATTGNKFGNIATNPEPNPRVTHITSGVIVMKDHTVLSIRLSNSAR